MGPDIFVLVEHVCGKTLDLSYMMLAQARKLSLENGGQVVAIILGYHAGELANDLDADAIWYVDHPALEDAIWGNYLAVLERLISQYSPRLVLLGNTTIGSGVANGLSARMNLPLVNNCSQLTSDGTHLRYTSPICGGKILVEGLLPSSTTLAVMIPGAFRVEQGKSSERAPVTPTGVEDLEELFTRNSQRYALKGYTEPSAGDVDIAKEKILVSVGRGIQNEDNLGLVQEFADALGATVSASRPVVDQNWLPSSRLVGKSGKTVKPRLYLALGISGAPEHTESITGSDTIIAVNTDPAAPIFNLAKYGVEMDLLDLLPVLTERLLASR